METSKRLDKYGFVTASRYRRRIVSTLKMSPMTPKQISNEISISLSHVSTTLAALKKEAIVECINPQRKKGRVYRLTETGKWIANKIACLHNNPE